jgi:heme-degrading monooxygenase HmoA
MFTRVVECTIKGKSNDFIQKLENEVLPILRDQRGFVDETVLVSTTNPQDVLALSFWKTREDAELYHREHFNRITQIIRPLLANDPRVRTFNVEHSTAHKIGAARAA